MDNILFIYSQYALVIVSGFFIMLGIVYLVRYFIPIVEIQTIANRIKVIKLKKELHKEREIFKQFKRGEYENE